MPTDAPFTSEERRSGPKEARTPKRQLLHVVLTVPIVLAWTAMATSPAVAVSLWDGHESTVPTQVDDTGSGSELADADLQQVPGQSILKRIKRYNPFKRVTDVLGIDRLLDRAGDECIYVGSAG